MHDRAVLVGPLTIDRYVDEGRHLPGGGALNMAYHWASLERPVTLIGRVGAADAERFRAFTERHGIDLSPAAVVDGPSSSIDIVFRPDGQPWMDGFVEGANARLQLADAELAPIEAGTPTHLVLVDVVDTELHRWAAADRLATARLSADFLDFRHMSTARFRTTAAHLDLAFVGWPGHRDDDQIAELVDAANDLGTVLVVTFGSAGVLAVDGQHESTAWFDVDAHPVTGTTVGCGDAFIAAFLHSWYETADIERAVDRGRESGAEATRWRRPLPEAAYA